MLRMRVLEIARLERTVLPGVAGDLGGDLEQVEVLPPHLQEDLALGVEFEGFLEGFLHLVLVLVVMFVIMFVLS